MKGTSLSWVIGLWLFLTFLLIVINLFSYKINLYLQENKPSKVEVRNPKYIYEIDVEFDPNYVFFCNKDNLKEFCEHFPIFIPTNFPFLPNYGTFNNTIGEYFRIKNFSGIFFIVNISDSIPKTNYMLVKVCNNENRNLTDVQIRIPIYYLAYQGIDKIKVNDTKERRPLPFCYEYRNLECKNKIKEEENNWNYHIWIKLNLSANECKILNISISKGDNKYAVDGSEIFDYYFTKFKVRNNDEVWDVNKNYKILYTDFGIISGKSDNDNEKIDIAGMEVYFNSSLFSNKVSDFYMQADDDFYVNDSFEYPSSSYFSWYKFYDLKNWTGNLATTFYIDTIRIRRKANVTVEITYPKILKKYYLILGEKSTRVSGITGITVEKNYITNDKLTIEKRRNNLKERTNNYVQLWSINNINSNKLIFNRSYTFAYANYSNIFIILPPNSTFTIIYNKTILFQLGAINDETYNLTEYGFYIWKRGVYLANGIICENSCNEILLWRYLDINRSFLYIFYGTNFDKFTVERMTDFFKFPKITVKFIKME